MITFPVPALDLPTESLPFWHRVEAFASPVATQVIDHTPGVFLGALAAYGAVRAIVTGLFFVVLVAWKPVLVTTTALVVALVLGTALAVLLLGVRVLLGKRAHRHVWRHLVPRPNWAKIRRAALDAVAPAVIARWAK